MTLLRLNDLKISTRLMLGFGALVTLTLLMGALALHSITAIADLTTTLADHPMRVLDETQQIKTNVVTIHRDMALLAQTSKPEQIEILASELNRLDLEIKTHLEVISSLYLGNPEDLRRLTNMLTQWRTLREETVAFKRTRQPDEAMAALYANRQRLEKEVEGILTEILDLAGGRAKKFRQMAETERASALVRLGGMTLGLLLLGLLVMRLITRSITVPLATLKERMAALAAGNLALDVPFREGNTELTAMAQAVQIFKEAAVKQEGQRWVKANVAHLSLLLQSSSSPEAFAQTAITALVPHLGGGAGMFYMWRDASAHLELLGSYGLKKRRSLHTRFEIGEGLVGQCAKEKKPIILTDVPDEYARITSGVGEASPRAIFVVPVVSKEKVLAVIEIGSFQAFSEQQQALIDEICPIFALNMEILERNFRTQTLLQQTQEQTEELRASEEELRAQGEQLQSANDDLRLKGERLQEQAEELRASEEELRAQREQLQESNAALADKSRGLQEQANMLEQARSDADKRALERDTASRYKSEFLANMSHELRTPLNSLLILARCLLDNDEGNLSEDQVDSARIIHDSGSSLLRLINDILDLSKVEAGKMEISAADIGFDEFRSSLLRRFRLLAESNGLALTVSIADDLPPVMRGDPGKLEQIINNLLGNAIKFTEVGGVSVQVKRATASVGGQEAFAIEVTDTGIGIPFDKMDSIFQAFEQVDGSTSRRYGGTGLGLTISRRLAQFLGGDIHVTSVPERGSVFSLILPLVTQGVAARADGGPDAKVGRLPASIAATVSADSTVPTVPTAATPSSAPTPRIPAVFSGLAGPQQIEDDRDNITPQDETVLVIEDDASFAKIVRDISRKRGFKCLVAGDGVIGLDLARRYRPTGIVLDIGLPSMDGWDVMERLKQHPETRHIPVHFMSATDSSQRGLEMGAVGYLTKPVSKQQIETAFQRIRHFATNTTRRLLLVDDDAGTRKAVHALLDNAGVDIIEESNGEAALARLRAGEHFDCMVLDLGLPGIGGVALLEQCTREHLIVPPVVVYSGRDLSDADTLALREYTDSIVIKGARSPERLLDEVTLFLHSVQSRLPVQQQQVLRGLHAAEGGIAGRSVLVVDDDMRNAFALSKALRAKGLKVLMAQDGMKALAQLADTPEIDLVLMDIMMPGMDGYETMQEIRKQARFTTLPIIALTAKAMVGDREKCLAAGANDYLSKPVDIDALMVMMREQLQA